MPQNKTSEAFVRQLTENQPRLYGYVYSLLGDHSRAADVVQETNLVLWRKIDEFDVGKPFLAWALGIARFQVLASLRDQKRDRLMLDAELAEQLSSEVAKQSEQFDDVRRSLRDCLQRLAPRGKELIELRYFRGLSTTEIATQLERSLSAVKTGILRVRRELADCVERRVQGETLP